MAYDLNQAGPQQEFGVVIPDGTFVWAVGIIRDGGATPRWADPADANLFKAAKDPNSDTISLDFEFTVQTGQHAKRKWFQFFTMDGGQRDDHGQSKGGNISKTFLRAMVESARGIRPDDQSAAAMQARNVASLRSLNGIPFGCRLTIEEGGPDPRGGTYPDKNRIAIIVTPEMEQYAPLRNGQEVPPQPTGVRRSVAGGQGFGQQKGVWAAPPQQSMNLAPPQQPAAPPPAQPAGGWAATPPAPPPQQQAAPPPPQQQQQPADQWNQGGGSAAPAPAVTGPGWITAPPT